MRKVSRSAAHYSGAADTVPSVNFAAFTICNNAKRVVFLPGTPPQANLCPRRREGALRGVHVAEYGTASSRSGSANISR
jgi:hypothetical protein